MIPVVVEAPRAAVAGRFKLMFDGIRSTEVLRKKWPSRNHPISSDIQSVSFFLGKQFLTPKVGQFESFEDITYWDQDLLWAFLNAHVRTDGIRSRHSPYGYITVYIYIIIYIYMYAHMHIDV